MQLAVKQFDSAKEEKKKIIDNVQKEANLLVVLSHDNIIKMVGIAWSEGFPCILMDYAENGSLKQLMHGECICEQCMVSRVHFRV